MQLVSILSVVACICLALVSAGKHSKTKVYSLSGKRVEAGKYARRCEKDEREVLIMDEDAEIKEVAKYLLSKNVGSAWIGGVVGTKYEGEFLLTVDAKKRGKYGSHFFTLVPANKVDGFYGKYFALCRKSDE